MPQVSRQLHILRALTDHLRGITPDDGYAYDLSASVYRGRTVFGADDPLPMLSILEAPRPDDQVLASAEEGVKRTEEWPLLLQGWVEDDKDHPTDPAYDLKATVEQRLGMLVATSPSGQPRHPQVHLLGGLVAGLRIGPGVVRPPQSGVSEKSFFYLPLSLRLAVDVTNPFVTTA